MSTATDILVVEDHRADAALIEQAVSPGLQTTVVTDGEAALETLRASKQAHSLPKLLILDLRLPDLTGLDVLQTIRDDWQLQTLPIVVLTNSKADADRKRAVEYGATRFVTKPMDFEAFEQTITELESTFLDK